MDFAGLLTQLGIGLSKSSLATQNDILFVKMYVKLTLLKRRSNNINIFHQKGTKRLVNVTIILYSSHKPSLHKSNRRGIISIV